MKIMTIFARRTSRRTTPPARTGAFDMPGHWTTRDWADLPVHHPVRD